MTSPTPDTRSLQSRVQDLEQELRLRMQELGQLERELRSAKADLAVKDDFIEHLHLERRRGSPPSFQQLLHRNGLRKLAAWVVGPAVTDRMSRLKKQA
jgi:hypothetical protein